MRSAKRKPCDHPGADDRQVCERIVPRGEKRGAGETACVMLEPREEKGAEKVHGQRARGGEKAERARGATGSTILAHAVQTVAIAGASKIADKIIPARARALAAHASAAKDEQIDQGILKKVHGVREQRHRSDAKRDDKLDAEIGEVQQCDDEDSPTQGGVKMARSWLWTSPDISETAKTR